MTCARNPSKKPTLGSGGDTAFLLGFLGASACSAGEAASLPTGDVAGTGGEDFGTASTADAAFRSGGEALGALGVAAFGGAGAFGGAIAGAVFGGAGIGITGATVTLRLVAPLVFATCSTALNETAEPLQGVQARLT